MRFKARPKNSFTRGRAVIDYGKFFGREAMGSEVRNDLAIGLLDRVLSLLLS
jgi:hypothetical protein